MISEHPQYSAKRYNFFVSEVCTEGLYAMQRNYAALLNMPIGLLNSKLPGNSTTAFNKKRTLMGLSTDLPDLAVGYMTGGRTAPLSERTLSGFIGLYTEHAAVLELPSDLSYLEKTCTKDGKTLAGFSVDVLSEVLRNGNSHLLVDIDEVTNKLVFVAYKNQTRVDWTTESADADDYRYSECIFRETDVTGDFETGKESETTYIRYFINENGIYSVARYNENKEQIGPTRQPAFKGRTLNFIPLTSIGTVDNSPDLDTALLEPIMQIMVAILGMDTELSYFNMLATAPTLIFTGVTEDSLPSILGPGTAVALPQPTSTAFYTSVDSSSLEHIREKINDAKIEAQEYGASLLGAQKNMSESGEALRLRQQATTVNLRSVVLNMGHGVLRGLQFIAEWAKSDKEAVSYEPNKEFSTFSLTAAEQQALVQSWQARAISHSTLLYNFRKASILQPGETVEQEKQRTEDKAEQFDDNSKEVNTFDKATQVAGDDE